MFKLQNNSCKICLSELNLDSKDAHIDHCHTTNKVRGILCRNCNLALGLMKDNVISLENAIKYLIT